MKNEMVSVAPVTKTLGDLFGLMDPRVKDVGFPVNPLPGGMTPTLNPFYQFDENQVRRLLLWIGGVARRNIMVHGPTGSGKSSVIEQVCARLGRECFRVACHGRMEFAELTGQLTVLSDGSTKFVHGPLPRAMLQGGVLLLDEVNFLHPSMVGALNTVLDGGPLLIPESNELIQPHPDFRVAATGNAVDQGDDAALYRGIQRMNLAFMVRFLMLRVDYLGEQEEAIMLNRYFPSLDGVLIEKMVKVANEVRGSFKRGDIEAPISTRTIVDWGSIMMARHSMLTANPESEVRFALQFVLTDGLKAEDSKAIVGVLERRIAGIQLKGHTPAVAQAQPGTHRKPQVRLDLLLNPNRDGNGSVSFWVMALAPGASQGMSGHGTIKPKLSIKKTTVRDSQTLNATMSEKLSASGKLKYSIGSALMVDEDIWEEVLQDTVKAISNALTNGSSSTIYVGTPEAATLIQPVLVQLNCAATVSLLK